AAIKLAIDKGLSKDAAIQSLTLTPAKLLGLQSVVGSIEKGKIANLVITDGEPWESKTKIKMVFIDGFKFDIPEPPATPERPTNRPNAPSGKD
ncbi:MAG: amidohydrolase family protein, partial [Holophagaceae bacterium]